MFLTPEDEEAVVDFVKENDELFNKKHELFKDRNMKDRLWTEFCQGRNLNVSQTRTWFESQRTRYGKLSQKKSGQAARDLIEREHWLEDKLCFLKSHIVRHIKSSGFKSRSPPSALQGTPPLPPTHDVSKGSTDITCSIESTPRVHSTPLRASPPRAGSDLTGQLMEQFGQMRSLLNTFITAEQGKTPASNRAAYFKFLAAEGEKLSVEDFSQFILETFTSLTCIQEKARESSTEIPHSAFTKDGTTHYYFGTAAVCSC